MLRRVLFEHRRFIVLLIVALAANVAVYAAFVYPLATRVADADNRASRADRARREARREYDAAKGVAVSKERAEAELRTFYGNVLPADVSAARRLTYLDLAQLARQSNLRVIRRTAAEDRERDSGLDHLQVELVIEGQYEDIRNFVYRLESAPGFVIVDDVTLGQARDSQGTLMLTMQLSTYYVASGYAS